MTARVTPAPAGPCRSRASRRPRKGEPRPKFRRWGLRMAEMLRQISEKTDSAEDRGARPLWTNLRKLRLPASLCHGLPRVFQVAVSLEGRSCRIPRPTPPARSPTSPPASAPSAAAPRGSPRQCRWSGSLSTRSVQPPQRSQPSSSSTCRSSAQAAAAAATVGSGGSAARRRQGGVRPP